MMHESVVLSPIGLATKVAEDRRASVPNNWLSIDWDFSGDFERLEETYRQRKKAVPVNFRELVPLHSGVDRASHLLHSYPAKLLVNIPIFFLNSKQLGFRNGVVLDPFCGTGTVLLEAILAGHKAVGADANPLARLIAQVKVTPLDPVVLHAACQTISKLSKRIKPLRFSPVVDVDRWFDPDVKVDLGRLLGAVQEIDDPPTRRFMQVCFSNCIRKVSRADPRMSVPVRNRKVSEALVANVAEVFERCVLLNIQRINTLWAANARFADATHIVDDARHLGKGRLSINADLIITSPPYLGAQKYIRASSLSIGWLGLAPENKLRQLERQSIGREHFSKTEYETLETPDVKGVGAHLQRVWKRNPLRAHIAATYLKEMNQALSEACFHLRKGGHFVLIIGDNSLCGAPFPTSRYLRNMLYDAGLDLRLALVDDIRSRGLMTKRNKTAGLIYREHIYVFQKL
jgi:hypothetical protein